MPAPVSKRPIPHSGPMSVARTATSARPRIRIGLTRSERGGGRRHPRRGRPRPRPRAGAPRLRALRSDLRRRRRPRASASRSAGRGGCRPAAPRRSPPPVRPSSSLRFAGRARWSTGFGAVARRAEAAAGACLAVGTVAEEPYVGAGCGVAVLVGAGAGAGAGAVTLRLAAAGSAPAFGVACVVGAARGASGVGVDASVPATRVARGSGDDAFVGASAICGDARPRGPAGGSSGCRYRSGPGGTGERGNERRSARCDERGPSSLRSPQRRRPRGHPSLPLSLTHRTPDHQAGQPLRVGAGAPPLARARPLSPPFTSSRASPPAVRRRPPRRPATTRRPGRRPAGRTSRGPSASA